MNEMVEQNRMVVISYVGKHCNDVAKAEINQILCEHGIVIKRPVGFVTFDESDLSKLVAENCVMLAVHKDEDNDNKVNKTLIDAIIFVDNFYKEGVEASAKTIDTIKVVVDTMHNPTLRNCFKIISNFGNQAIIDYSKKFTSHQFSLAFIKVIKDIVNNVSWGTCE